MLVKELFELDNCKEHCPLYDEFCSGGMACYGGMPIEPPCVNWDGNDDVEDIYSSMVEGRRRYEEALDKKIEAEQKAKEKKEERNKKAREARWHVREEQREIIQLKKMIKCNEKLLSFAKAANFANEMFGYTGRVDIENHPLTIENKKIQTRIDELTEIKKKKLKELRAKRKSI